MARVGIPFLCVSINCTDWIHRRDEIKGKEKTKRRKKEKLSDFYILLDRVNLRYFMVVFSLYSFLCSGLPAIYSLESHFFSSFRFILSWGGLVYIFTYFSQYFALFSFLFPSPLPSPRPTLPILRRKTDKLGKLFLFNVFLSPLVFLTFPAFLLASSRSVVCIGFFSLSLFQFHLYIQVNS